MKINNYLAITVFSLIFHLGYSQTIKDVDSVLLRYSKDSNEIIKPAKRNLYIKKDAKYKFIIYNTNDALFSLSINPQFISKTTAVPSLIQGLVATATPTVVATLDFPVNMFSPPILPPTMDAITYQLNRIDTDYLYIQYLVIRTKNLIAYLNKNWSDTAKCRNFAKSEVDSITKRFNFLITNQTHKPSQIKPNADNIKSINDSIVTDFTNDINLLQTYLMTCSPTTENLPKINEAYNLASFVKNNKDFISKCPDVIKSIVNCNSRLVSKPLRMDRGDYLNLNLALLKNNFYDKPDTISRHFRFYMTKYWKVDYTVGIFINNVTIPTYHFTDTTGHIAKETNPSVDMGLGALVTLQRSFSCAFKAGGSAGISVSFVDSKPRYLLGGSIVFGKKSSLMFSGGLSGASVAVPSNVLNTGSSGTLSSGFDAKNFALTVPTYNTWQFGWFAGITYNFFPH